MVYVYDNKMLVLYKTKLEKQLLWKAKEQIEMTTISTQSHD